MPVEAPNLLAGLQVPEPDSVIPATGKRLAAIRRDLHTATPGAMTFKLHDLLSFQVPGIDAHLTSQTNGSRSYLRRLSLLFLRSGSLLLILLFCLLLLLCGLLVLPISFTCFTLAGLPRPLTAGVSAARLFRASSSGTFTGTCCARFAGTISACAFGTCSMPVFGSSRMP